MLHEHCIVWVLEKDASPNSEETSHLFAAWPDSPFLLAVSPAGPLYMVGARMAPLLQDPCRTYQVGTCHTCGKGLWGN